VDVTAAVLLGRDASTDPAVKVLSPGFVDGAFLPGGRMDTFLAAESGFAPGAFGFDAFEETAIHIYGASYTPLWPTNRLETSITNAKAIWARYPALAGRPWHVTEQGMDGSPASGAWAGLTLAQKGLTLARNVLVQGVLGAKSVCLYSHDSNWIGDARNAEIAAALDAVHQMAGQTYTTIALRADGALVTA